MSSQELPHALEKWHWLGQNPPKPRGRWPHQLAVEELLLLTLWVRWAGSCLRVEAVDGGWGLLRWHGRAEGTWHDKACRRWVVSLGKEVAGERQGGDSLISSGEAELKPNGNTSSSSDVKA